MVDGGGGGGAGGAGGGIIVVVKVVDGGHGHPFPNFPAPSTFNL